MDSRRLGFHLARVQSHVSPEAGLTTELVGPPRLLHQFLERQASRTPDATALICGGISISYGELDARANQLAHFLCTQGIGPGSSVALLLRRSENLYIALLGVLKSGAAYVPLDPDYPNERIRFILEDCAAPLVLTCAALANKAAGFQGKILALEHHRESIADQPRGGLTYSQGRPSPEDLCYVIYPSGTTGRPKGVAIEHRSAAHLVATEN